MFKDFTIVILHAGNILEIIDIGRWCRQADPIASLLFILCIEILFIKFRTSPPTKPFKINYQLNPFKSETVEKYMDGFADDITLCVENSSEGTENITKIIEDFGNISGLRINKDKTQAMIFVHKSRTATPENNNIGVTLTCPQGNGGEL